MIGKRGTSAHELCVGIASIQNRPDALAVGNIEELGELSVGNFFIEVVVFKKVLCKKDLLVKGLNGVEVLVSGKSTKSFSEVASCLLGEETACSLDCMRRYSGSSIEEDEEDEEDEEAV